MSSNSPQTEFNRAPKSRRALLLELGGVVAVVATPVGAVIATARPIPSPPAREELNSVAPQRSELVEERRNARRQATEEAIENSRWNKAREQRKRARERRQGTPESQEGQAQEQEQENPAP